MSRSRNEERRMKFRTLCLWIVCGQHDESVVNSFRRLCIAMTLIHTAPKKYNSTSTRIPSVVRTIFHRIYLVLTDHIAWYSTFSAAPITTTTYI